MSAMHPHRFLLALAALLFTTTGCPRSGTEPGRADGGSDAGASDANVDAASSGDGGSDTGAADAGRAPVVTIFQIQDPDAAGHVAIGASVRVEGAIVAAVDAFEENGAGMGNLNDVWVADPAGGPFSGVHVYMPAHTPCAGHAALAIGDTVDVTGSVQEFSVPSDGSGRTVTQLIGGTVTCTTAGSGAGPTPMAFTDAAMLTTDATAEPWEGVLVEVSNVEATSDPDHFGTEPLRIGPPIDDDLYAHPGSRRDRFTTLRGVFHYMFGRWELLPRAATDIVLGTPRLTEDESGLWGCGDGEDSDGDSAIDCLDADCAGTAFCAGVTVHVEDVQDTSSFAHPAADTDVALFGPLVVTSIDTFAEMTGAGYTGTVVVQNADAVDPRYSGIHVFVPAIEPCGAALALGDRVYVAGHYEEYAEAGDTATLSEITGGIVSCRMPGAPLVPTSITTASDLGAAATAEPWEGVLVQITDVDVTMPAGMFGRFQVGGSVYVDDDVYRTTVTLADHFARITGVLTYQFEYQLEPRVAEDIELGPSEHDDASCSNGTDDDGDGATDCGDLDCCAAAPCQGAVAARRLILSEVVYDPTGADDTHEWVELRNAGTSAVPLACYALGSGPTSYRYSIAQLPAITIPAGGCVLIGGPDCGGGACTSDLNFEPDLHNGTAGSASGVALLYSLASAVSAATTPVDAVLYGTANTGMLRDATGAIPASANVIDVAAGHSIARAADGTWTDVAAPTPGTCTTFTPP
jgi:hypothetical protein